MARPSGWDILGLDGDPTPGVVESVQALAKEFGDFAHDVESAYRSLNSFGSDTAAMQWIGQTAEAFKSNYGPLPGRLQKLYTSYSEASDALSAYAPKLQAAQAKADSALRQAQDAHADLQRATANATNAATDLKTAQQNQAANPNQQAVTDAQTAHNTAQTNLDNAKARMADLTKQAQDAYHDRINAAEECGKAIGHAQSDGIHNKHWWEHVGEWLSEVGGEIAEIANDLAPFLDVLALATSWIPGVDVITAALAEADNIVALIGTGMQIAGDAMQGHWGDALMGVGMLGLQFAGGKLLGKLGSKVEGEAGALERDAGSDIGKEARSAEGNEFSICKDDPIDVVSGYMLTFESDLELPGVLPLVLRRAYSSGYETGRLFGPGWSSTLDQRLSVNEAGVHFVGDDAQRLDYPTPADAEPVLPARGARWPLVWDREADEIRITDPWSGQTRHFATVHFADELGQIRDLTAITDRNGNTISILRDETGTPTAVEHPAYRVALDTAPTAAGPRITALRLLDGSEDGALVRQYHYDERGRLTGVVDHSGLPFTYHWDESDRISAWVDRVGYRYGYEYDDHGRVVRTHGDGGYLSGRFVYDADNRSTVHTNSLGATTTFYYDESGHLTATVDPAGGTTVTEYDAYGHLMAQTDPLGRRTLLDRDSAGNVLRRTEADGGVYEFEYNEAHQIVRAVMADGTVWTRDYDEHGNLLAVVDPTGAATHREYGEHGAQTAGVDPSGARVRIETDAAGLPCAVTDPLGGVTRAERDAFGRVVSMVDAVGRVTRFAWTPEGLLTSQTEHDGARTEWTYDAEGNLVATTNPVGGVTLLEPGPFGRILARTGPDGTRFEFRHDTELNLLAVTNTAGATWSYEYDAAGRLAAETDFVGRALTYTHDASGLLTARTNGLGQQTVFVHDAVGRVVQRQTPDGTFDYAYDPMGRLVRASNADSVVEYSRDALGRVRTEVVDGRSMAYEYDAAGRCVRRTTPTGAVSQWSYDSAGRPQTLTAGPGSLGFGFDAAGSEVIRVFGADSWLSYELDAVGRPAAQRLWNGPRQNPGDPAGPQSNLLLDRTWRWRPDGTPVEIHDSLRGGRRITSDQLGRVTAVSAASWTESYTYDAYGNVASLEGAANAAGVAQGAAEGLADHAADRTLVKQAGRTTYEHDAAGRLVRSVRRTLDGRRRVAEFTWDSEDRLVQVVNPDGARWRYSYDPFGRRVGKARIGADGAVLERVVFTWDGPRLAEQYSAGAESVSTLTWDYDPGTFHPAAQRRRSWAADAGQELIDEAFHAIVTDLVGTPTELVSSDGRIVWHTASGLWGQAVSVSADPGVECPLRFPGQYHDGETGLNYNLHRYYDPETAGFLTPDPLGLAPSPNDHGYVPNPLTWSDPLGLSGCNAVMLDASTARALVSGDRSVANRLMAQIGDRTMHMTTTGHGEFTAALTRLDEKGFLGPTEKGMADDLLNKVRLIPDDPSARAMALTVTKKVGANDKLIFGTADKLGMPIFTADEKFLVGAMHQGVVFDAIVHPPINTIGV